MAFILIYIGFYSSGADARTSLLLLLLLPPLPVRVRQLLFSYGNPVAARASLLLLLLLLLPIRVSRYCYFHTVTPSLRSYTSLLLLLPPVPRAPYRFDSPIMFGNPRRRTSVALLFERGCYCSNACCCCCCCCCYYYYCSAPRYRIDSF